MIRFRRTRRYLIYALVSRRHSCIAAGPLVSQARICAARIASSVFILSTLASSTVKPFLTTPAMSPELFAPD